MKSLRWLYHCFFITPVAVVIWKSSWLDPFWKWVKQV